MGLPAMHLGQCENFHAVLGDEQRVLKLSRQRAVCRDSGPVVLPVLRLQEHRIDRIVSVAATHCAHCCRQPHGVNTVQATSGRAATHPGGSHCEHRLDRECHALYHGAWFTILVVQNGGRTMEHTPNTVPHKVPDNPVPAAGTTKAR